jgi:hypothetical protein
VVGEAPDTASTAGVAAGQETGRLVKGEVLQTKRAVGQDGDLCLH